MSETMTKNPGQISKVLGGQFDMAAVGRVARRVNLETLVLVRQSASRFPFKGEQRVLMPDVTHAHRVVGFDEKTLETESRFAFTVRLQGTIALRAALTYRLVYAIQGDDAVDPQDAKAFANVNGAHHAWPFVREAL